MKPCDCETMLDALVLREQGIKFNNQSITVDPPGVILEIDPYVRVKFTRNNFKRFAEWYLTNQPGKDVT